MKILEMDSRKKLWKFVRIRSSMCQLTNSHLKGLNRCKGQQRRWIKRKRQSMIIWTFHGAIQNMKREWHQRWVTQVKDWKVISKASSNLQWHLERTILWTHMHKANELLNRNSMEKEVDQDSKQWEQETQGINPEEMVTSFKLSLISSGRFHQV